MPYLTTSEAVRTRLHAALAGRSAWVFLHRPGVRVEGEQDLILLPGSERGREALTAAAVGLAAGTCFDQTAEAN